MSIIETEFAGRTILEELRATYPDAPFLALGQTVFWDEPVKAVLLRMLDWMGGDAHMVAGVHDTDYFAKTRTRRAGQGRFALLAHNDGTTRDLWSVAGEISTLFGSETVPRKNDLIKNGVPFDRLLRAQGIEQQAFYDAVTEAWGWRGLVYTGSRDLIVSRLPLKDVGNGILEMLSWAFEIAVVQIGPDCCSKEAHAVAEKISGWCIDYCAANPELFLTDLFQYVLPRIYALLMQHEPSNLDIVGTSNLLRFAPDTCQLKRFSFVGLFIDPETRDMAVNAYNAAVAGSTIYSLDKFGAGALPFDVIVPGHGRGTLRITPRVVFIETPQPIAIGLKKPITSIEELAELLCHRLGNQLTLVGKAVTLVSMLAQEFIFVFNEEGSTYVTRTRQMNDELLDNGIPLEMRPILRMRYETWDALSAAHSTLRLPEHLASTFGRSQITAPEFAASWRTVVGEQRELCKHSAALKKPRELLGYLQDRDPVGGWDARLAAYESAKDELRLLRARALPLHAEIAEIYARVAADRATRRTVEAEMCRHFHATSNWTEEETATRAAFQASLDSIGTESRCLKGRLLRLKTDARAIECSEQAKSSRTVLDKIELEAEMARLNLVRNALLTVEGLEHTNHRPSAWWMPMLDASGQWLHRIVATTNLYTEPLQTH